jgi:hypothetical protein
MDAVHPEVVSDIYGVHSTEVSKVPPKFELLHPLFGWLQLTLSNALLLT